jgi:hypothetical protein
VKVISLGNRVKSFDTAAGPAGLSPRKICIDARSCDLQKTETSAKSRANYATDPLRLQLEVQNEKECHSGQLHTFESDYDPF